MCTNFEYLRLKYIFTGPSPVGNILDRFPLPPPRTGTGAATGGTATNGGATNTNAGANTGAGAGRGAGTGGK